MESLEIRPTKKCKKAEIESILIDALTNSTFTTNNERIEHLKFLTYTKNGFKIHSIIPLIFCDGKILEEDKILKRLVFWISLIKKGLIKDYGDAVYICNNCKSEGGIFEDKFNLLPIFILEAFVRESEKLFRFGLKKEYERIDGSEKFLKGKILFKEDYKVRTTLKIRQTYFIRTYNSKLNGLILYGAKSLQSLLDKSHFKLKRIIKYLEDLNIKEHSCYRDVKPCMEYKYLYDLIKIIKTMKGFDNKSRYLLKPILINENKLFESFITEILLDLGFKPQESIFVGGDKGSIMKIKPDLINNTQRCILDIKNKEPIDKEGNLSYDQSDIYQVYFYKKMLERIKSTKYKAGLIYRGNKNMHKEIILKDNTKIHLWYISIDYDIDENKIKENIKDMKRKFTLWLNAP